MRIVLEIDSDKALYQQIRDQVVEGIATGELLPGESLPSTRQLAADFGINFHTVNKAYDLLRQEGLLRLNRKTGAVIRVDALTDVQREAWHASLKVLLAEGFVKGMSEAEILQSCTAAMADFVVVDGQAKAVDFSGGEMGEQR